MQSFVSIAWRNCVCLNIVDLVEATVLARNNIRKKWKKENLTSFYWQTTISIALKPNIVFVTMARYVMEPFGQ
jgi:hypothetical protein